MKKRTNPLNCLTFALWMWLRLGGYLIIRKSRHQRIPHFLWASEGSLDEVQGIRHYTPLHPRKSGWWRALWFKGGVKYRDRQPCPTKGRVQCTENCEFMRALREERAKKP